MQLIKNISIPQPCHQSWDDMIPVEQGRHCQSCAKTVIDFTAMDNAGIIAYLASHKNTCGRIGDSRLASINYQLELEDKQQFSWKGLFAAASIGMLFPTVSAEAQIGSKSAQMPYVSFPTGRVLAVNKPGKVTLKGTVTAIEDGQPVSGVSLVIKGTSTGTQTAADGSFQLMALNPADTLVISSVGFKPIEILVGQATEKLHINLEDATTALNDVVVKGYQTSRRQCSMLGSISTVNRKKILFFLRWWYWLVHKAGHIIAAINPF
jgi:hypothetical protein